ncbi:EamA family transporter [Bacillus aerolatus]|uniref:EamA family transporter n=1 Tax=Bacillus aerolatus TaxID=2653354 RepID=A0A6I1FFZ9_9BACI|nr:DMT family transporter [Bacillus aerolatus]KAB7704260.1 EamA family transporter [Bacillus aerolatus]
MPRTKPQGFFGVSSKFTFVIFVYSVVVFNSLVYKALHYTTSINASLMNSSTPIIIFILSFLFLKERLHRSQVIGSILSLLGVLFILTKGNCHNVLSFSFNLGVYLSTKIPRVQALQKNKKSII